MIGNEAHISVDKKDTSSHKHSEVVLIIWKETHIRADYQKKATRKKISKVKKLTLGQMIKKANRKKK